MTHVWKVDNIKSNYIKMDVIFMLWSSCIDIRAWMPDAGGVGGGGSINSKQVAWQPPPKKKKKKKKKKRKKEETN